jgi:DNA-binding ferritin-like protein
MRTPEQLWDEIYAAVRKRCEEVAEETQKCKAQELAEKTQVRRSARSKSQSDRIRQVERPLMSWSDDIKERWDYANNPPRERNE